MQITPTTAKEIERLSGGTTFTLEDLSNPEINIRYGTFYLAALLNQFEGSEVAALAAYHAGPTAVEEWGGSSLRIADIPIEETRDYVEEVLDKRKDLVDPLAMAILEGRFGPGDTVRVDAVDGELVLERAAGRPGGHGLSAGRPVFRRTGGGASFHSSPSAAPRRRRSSPCAGA